MIDDIAASRRLTEQVRALIDGVVRVPPGPSTAALADRVAALVAELDTMPPDSTVPWPYRLTSEERAALTHLMHDRSDEAVGTSWTRFNPVAPPIALTVTNEQAFGSVVFGPAFSGNSGRVHGGTVATVLDHAMASLLSHLGRPSFTARLEVDYRASAPVGAQVDVRSRIDRIDGRKTWLEATAAVADVVVARSVGLFLTRTAS